MSVLAKYYLSVDAWRAVLVMIIPFSFSFWNHVWC
jgi:hypothetical protein